MNASDFLTIYTDRFVTDTLGVDIKPESINIDGYDDTAQWLFTGWHSEMTGRDPDIERPNYRITETFLHCGELQRTWNTPYGVTGYKAYETTDFSTIPRPPGKTVSIGIGLRT